MYARDFYLSILLSLDIWGELVYTVDLSQMLNVKLTVQAIALAHSAIHHNSYRANVINIVTKLPKYHLIKCIENDFAVQSKMQQLLKLNTDIHRYEVLVDRT